MKILWYADWDGDLQDVDELTEVLEEVGREAGITTEGPFYPQNETLLYILDAPNFEALNRSGRRFFEEASDLDLPVTPMRYDVAVTPEEFWGI